jgi:hypothetical protein
MFFYGLSSLVFWILLVMAVFAVIFQEATWLWAAIFAASAAGLAAAMAVASVNVVLLLTTAVTIGGVVAGALLSALWFVRVLRRFGLHVHFIQA